jgi:hypothetical protein
VAFPNLNGETLASKTLAGAPANIGDVQSIAGVQEGLISKINV